MAQKFDLPPIRRALRLICWLSAVLPVLAQDGLSPKPGFEFRSLSGYAIYYSKSLPLSAGFQPVAGDLPSDLGAGASAVIGWSRFGRTNIVFTYIPSYTGRVRYSGVNALNQASSISIMRKVAPRWNWNFSGAADYSSIEQFLFSSTTFGNVASVPATFDDLSAAMLAGKFTNPLLASTLTSAPLADSPARNLLYGARIFTSGAQTSLSYSHSPRLSVTFNASGSRNQHVSDSNSIAGRNDHLIPNTTAGNAGIAFTYALTPATQIGGSISGSRVVSSLLEDRYTTTSLATVGRTVAKRWLLQVHGGVGVISSVRAPSTQAGTRPTKALPVVGGTIGLKSFSHTVLGSYDRTASDSYGLGATTSSSSAATWRWSRPGRHWWLESGLSWERLQGNMLVDMSGWRTTTGLGRAVGAHTTLLTEYVYLSYSGRQLANRTFSQSAVRVSLLWNRQTNVFR